MVTYRFLTYIVILPDFEQDIIFHLHQMKNHIYLESVKCSALNA